MLWSELAFLECPDTSTLKGKTKQKTAGSRRGTRRKTAQPGEASSTTAVGLTTVRPWLPPRAVVATVVVVQFCCPCATFWCLLVFRLGPRGFPFVGSFGPLCRLLLILMAHTSLAWIHLKHFSPNLGFNHRNLQ